MKSFPTTFTVNPLVQSGTFSVNLKTTLMNIGENVMHNALNDGSDSGLSKSQLGENLDLRNFDFAEYASWEGTSSGSGNPSLPYNPSVTLNNFSLLDVHYTEYTGEKERKSNVYRDDKGNWHFESKEEDKKNNITETIRLQYENPFKIPTEVLKQINRYRYVKTVSAIERRKVTVDDSTETTDKKQKESQNMSAEDVAIEAISQSLFNPIYGVRAQGFMKFLPKLNTQFADTGKPDGGGKYTADGIYLGDNVETTTDDNGKTVTKREAVTSVKLIEAGNDGKASASDKTITADDTKIEYSLSSNTSPDFTDCSIRTLVALSHGLGTNKETTRMKNEMNSMGRANYRYIDFMYCRDVGKISNNHLITLRRFTHPVGDNIYNSIHNSAKEPPDRGHLVTWFGNDENKLEDICKYTMNSSWKELNSKIQDIESKEDDSHIGASIINLLNPNYVAGVMKGYWGGNNCITNWMASKIKIFEAKGSYEGDSSRYYMDQNKVWSPPNTIQSTHVYEGKIQFAHEFSLTFTYEIKHYDGINGKTAFMDLMGNILRVCHNTGTFWGGQNRFLGAPRNSAGWKKMNAMLDAFEKGAQGFIDGLFSCQNMSELGSWLTDFFHSAYEAAKEMVTGAVGYVQSEKFKDDAHKAVKTIANLGMGMLRNKLGRPAMYAMDSLLNGSYVGMWHVTIGNPRNPILSIGNLMLMNTEVQHYGPLGLDDFPTKLKVVCTLKHGRPRDATEIASMYTMGQGGLLLPLNKKQFREYFNVYDPDEMAHLGWVTETYEQLNSKDNKMDKIIVEQDVINTTWGNVAN